MPKDDAWDWPLLLYVGTVTLKRPEKVFWKMTPRKLSALVNAHMTIQGGGEDKSANNTANKPGFIDQIF
jgi:hypothetical protein